MGRRDPGESQFDLSLGTNLISFQRITRQQRALAPQLCRVRACASTGERVQALYIKKKLTFEAIVSNEDTHQTHSCQSVSRGEVTVGHLQIPPVSKVTERSKRLHTFRRLLIRVCFLVSHRSSCSPTTSQIYVSMYVNMCNSLFQVYVSMPREG